MSLNLSGKYWRIQDLEKEFSKPAAILYPILNSLTGVIRIGSVFLVPDALLPVIRQRINMSNSYTQSTVMVILRINKKLLGELISHGLPVFKNDNGEARIWKSCVPALQRAIFEIRQRQGDFNESHIDEALKMAMAEGESHD